MQVEIVTMTPELATKLLARNIKNRNVAQAGVAALARDMAAGKWRPNGDAIRIAKSGLLLDGQHRLMACVQSGVSFQTLLVSDIDEDARCTIDTGRKRSLGDELSIKGRPNAKTLASGVRGVFLYLTNSPYGGTMRPTNQELLQTLEALEAANVPMDALSAMARHTVDIVPGSGMLPVLALTYAHFWPMQQEFCDRIADGANLSVGDPRLALRNTMLAIQARSVGSKLSTPEAIRAVTLTWNAFVRGRHIKHVKIGMASGDLWLRIEGAPAPEAGLEALKTQRNRLRSSVVQEPQP